MATASSGTSRATEHIPSLAPPPLSRAERPAELPLSFAQQRLWFIDQLERGSSAYNMSLGVQLRGKLSEDALRRTLNGIIRRHEVLRTTFPMCNGAPVQ